MPRQTSQCESKLQTLHYETWLSCLKFLPALVNDSR